MLNRHLYRRTQYNVSANRVGLSSMNTSYWRFVLVWCMRISVSNNLWVTLDAEIVSETQPWSCQYTHNCKSHKCLPSEIKRLDWPLKQMPIPVIDSQRIVISSWFLQNDSSWKNTPYWILWLIHWLIYWLLIKK